MDCRVSDMWDHILGFDFSMGDIASFIITYSYNSTSYVRGTHIGSGMSYSDLLSCIYHHIEVLSDSVKGQ